MEGNGYAHRAREFSEFLQDHPELHEDASNGLRDLVAAVQNVGKRGKLTLTVTIDPSAAGDVSILTVAADVKVAAPLIKPQARIFYVQKDGGIGRRDPRQTTIFDASTGEVVG